MRERWKDHCSNEGWKGPHVWNSLGSWTITTRCHTQWQTLQGVKGGGPFAYLCEYGDRVGPESNAEAPTKRKDTSVRPSLTGSPSTASSVCFLRLLFFFGGGGGCCDDLVLFLLLGLIFLLLFSLLTFFKLKNTFSHFTEFCMGQKSKYQQKK